jgi:hypothetical protein
LIEKVREAFRALPDGRKQSNARLYEMEDAALSAFAVFFSQSPSFLDSQVRMQKQLGRNNASSLFGVHEFPAITRFAICWIRCRRDRYTRSWPKLAMPCTSKAI